MSRHARHAAIVLLLASTSVAAQATWFVDADATGASSGLTWSDAFVDLRDALAVATSGDQIWVAEGLYQPDAGTKNTNLKYIVPSGVALYGGFACNEVALEQRDALKHPTVLSGDLDGDDTPSTFLHHVGIDDNSHFILWVSGVTEAVTIDGFSIRGGVGGTVAGCILSDGGGGIYARDSMLSVRQCDLRLNSADFGGAGMLLIHSTATIEDCRFEMNTIIFGENGAGVAACDSDVRLVDCQFENNPKNPVILRSGSTGTIEGCRFIGNIGWSGDLEIHDSAWAQVRLCSFVASDEGGVTFDNASGTIEDCLFVGNVSQYPGAAIGSSGSELTIERCTVVSNSTHGTGGGLLVYGNPSTVIRDCIFWGNDSDEAAGQKSEIDFLGPAGLVEVSHSCIQGWDGSLGGAGNMKLNPQFVDFDGADGLAGTKDDDLRLTAASPCVDAGGPATVAGPTDLVGAPRTLDGNLDGSMVVDMGALEFSNVTLSARLTDPPSPVVALDVQSAQPLLGFLLVGVAPGATTIPPFGTLLVAPAGVFVRVLVGPLPFHADVPIPATPALPDQVFLQALGIQPAAGVGNFSDLVALDLSP